MYFVPCVSGLNSIKHLVKLVTETLTEYIPRKGNQKLSGFTSKNADFFSLDVNLIKIEQEEEEKKEKKLKTFNDRLKYLSLHVFTEFNE